MSRDEVHCSSVVLSVVKILSVVVLRFLMMLMCL